VIGPPMAGESLSVGVDLVELERLRRVLERYGERFLERVYTPEEAARFGRTLPELAARFAAKEAVSKALGVGMRLLSANGIGWHDVAVLPDPRGKPQLYLSGRARELAEEQGLVRWAISLTHGRDYALAFVVAQGDQ
jgi:holo-[acyl-carrier protein] synthase